MLEIYRPYVSAVKTSFCLSDKDLSLMKHNSRIVIQTICELCKWTERTGTSRIYAKDPFVRFYFNDGSPDINFLLDYYYAMHLALKRNCGEKIDLMQVTEDYSKIYNKHKQECCKIKWSAAGTMLHRMYLLKSDKFWYKRHFKNTEELERTGKIELQANGNVITGE